MTYPLADGLSAIDSTLHVGLSLALLALGGLLLKLVQVGHDLHLIGLEVATIIVIGMRVS